MGQTASGGYVGGIQRFSTSDGPGIRTTVFLKGCPLSCAWCHNPELIGFGAEIIHSENRCIACGACARACPQQAVSLTCGGFRLDRALCDHCMACTKVCCAQALRSIASTMTVAEVMELLLRDRGYYEESGGGVTISGGEVLSQAEFILELLHACKREHLTVALDTSGFGSGEALHRMADACDYILFDIKAGLEETHRALTGVSLAPIRANLRRLAEDPELCAKLHLRIPLVSGVNDTQEEIEATCAFLCGMGIQRATLLPYHELGISKSRGLGLAFRRFSPPAPERMHQIRDCLTNVGIHTEIGGEDI